MSERLQKLLARAGYGSRRHCETLITSGRVRVNGQVARLGQRADPLQDCITVDGEKISYEKTLYIMLNKPRGVLSSTEDEMQQGRRTVRDLVNIPGHLYPIGRLDKNSEGLMLLTNDGPLAYRLTHPSFGHEKEYLVEMEGAVSHRALNRWRKGVMLDERLTAPAKIELVESSDMASTVRVTLREGRKRQIRRIAAALGHPVTRLVRQRIATITLDDLESGQWRHLTEQEINALRESVDRSVGQESGGAY